MIAFKIHFRLAKSEIELAFQWIWIQMCRIRTLLRRKKDTFSEWVTIKEDFVQQKGVLGDFVSRLGNNFNIFLWTIRDGWKQTLNISFSYSKSNYNNICPKRTVYFKGSCEKWCFDRVIHILSHRAITFDEIPYWFYHKNWLVKSPGIIDHTIERGAPHTPQGSKRKQFYA